MSETTTTGADCSVGQPGCKCQAEHRQAVLARRGGRISHGEPAIYQDEVEEAHTLAMSSKMPEPDMDEFLLQRLVKRYGARNIMVELDSLTYGAGALQNQLPPPSDDGTLNPPPQGPGAPQDDAPAADPPLDVRARNALLDASSWTEAWIATLINLMPEERNDRRRRRARHLAAEAMINADRAAEALEQAMAIAHPTKENIPL